MKNVPFVLAALLVALGAGWLFQSASSASDAKTEGLMYVAAFLVAVVSVCMLCVSPAVRNSGNSPVRLLGELPMAFLVFLATCIGLLFSRYLVEDAYGSVRRVPPDWVDWIYFPLAVAVAIAIPSWFVYRDLKKIQKRRVQPDSGANGGQARRCSL